MKSFLFFLVFILSVIVSYSQQDTLPEVQIEANKINNPSSTYKVVPLSIANNNSLSEVLQSNSAIYLKSYGVGNLSTVSIRGANASQTQLIWNGFTINSPTLGQNDLSISSTSLIDQASLHLGASSLVNSSGGLGGAIQLENKTNFKNRIHLSVSKELGSFGIDNTIAKLKLGNEKWQFFTGFAKKHADNDFKYNNFLKKNPELVRQENATYDQLEVAQNIYYKPSLNHQLGLKTNFTTTERLLPSIMGVESKGEKQLDDAIKSALEWSYNSGNYFHQLSVGYFYDFLNYIDTSVLIDSRVAINSFKGYYKGKYYFNDSVQLRLSLTTDKIFATSSNFNSRKYQVRDAGFVEYYQLLRNSLSYTISLRKELISEVKTPLVPAISLKWNKWKKHKLFLSGARNFRAPTFNDLYWSPGGNLDLLPENGLLAELGYEYQKKKTLVGVTTYYSFINNWIQWLPSNKGYWSPVNLKEVESYGVEFSVEKKYKIKEVGLSLVGNYNFVLAQNKASIIEGDASISKQLIYVPRNTASLQINITFKCLNLNYRQSYNGSVFIDATNQTYMPYYAPANLRLDWKVNKPNAKNDFSIGATIDNLYNEEYQIVANRPLPGRYYRLILKVGLSK
jgi:iron complex outermembrane receptor protein